MTTSLTWMISNLECIPVLSEDLANVIKIIHWRVMLVDGDYRAECYGSVGLPDPTEESFVLFDDVTEEEVITWLLDALGEEHVERITTALENDIELQKNPPIVQKLLPWLPTVPIN